MDIDNTRIVKGQITKRLMAAGFERDSFGYFDYFTSEREQGMYPLYTHLIRVYPSRVDRDGGDGAVITYRFATILREAGFRASVQQNHAEDPGVVQIDPRPR